MFDKTFMEAFSYLTVIDGFDERPAYPSARLHFMQTTSVILSLLHALVKVFLSFLASAYSVCLIKASVLGAIVSVLLHLST